jgi:hypothetical protein
VQLLPQLYLFDVSPPSTDNKALLLFMAAASPSVGFPPHPYLQSSTLFICPSSLPSHVLEEHVEAIFKGSHSNASVSFTRVKKGRNRGALRARVDFPDLNSGTGFILFKFAANEVW